MSDDLKDQIESINAEGKRLTDWEREFMESIGDQFDRHGFLTERQQEIVAEIYDKRVVNAEPRRRRY